jgi:hypothetical protein
MEGRSAVATVDFYLLNPSERAAILDKLASNVGAALHHQVLHAFGDGGGEHLRGFLYRAHRIDLLLSPQQQRERTKPHDQDQ